MPPAKLKRSLYNAIARETEAAVGQEPGTLGAEKSAQRAEFHEKVPPELDR
jgi:hypothetical protein